MRMDTLQFKNRIIILSDKLFRLAKSILQNEDEAWDAVQDLNLKLWEKRIQLNEIENIPAFAMRSMRNLCLDVLRQRRNNDHIDTDIEYQELNPYQQTERNDMVTKIQLLIDRLPELQRTIMRMRDVEGMEISEISYITQITENAVSVNLSRARQKVREQLITEHSRAEERIWRT